MSTWLSATVLPGHHQGSQLGFPTANVDPTLAPVGVAPGVWVAKMRLRGTQYWSAAHYGARSTFQDAAISLEFHLLDFTGDIVGQSIEFRLLKHLRPTQYFPSVAELIAQLHADVAAVQEFASSTQPHI